MTHVATDRQIIIELFNLLSDVINTAGLSDDYRKAHLQHIKGMLGPAEVEVPTSVSRCPTCKYWHHPEGDPTVMGICTVLTRSGGTVSTWLDVECGSERPDLRTSRHFGCTLHTPRAALAPAPEAQ